MKLLQNNFTTPEQSKRLLELGVPADSADCYIINDNLFILLDKWKYTEYIKGNASAYLPCWSVGRLIEIILNTLINNGIYNAGIFIQKETFNIDYFIDILDEDIECFDFSKLED